MLKCSDPALVSVSGPVVGELAVGGAAVGSGVDGAGSEVLADCSGAGDGADSETDCSLVES